MTKPLANSGSWVWDIVDNSIGFVKRLYFDKCSPSPAVWVETLPFALMRAAWSLVEPDNKEVYHQLRGKSLQCDLKSAIREAQEASGAEETAADRFVFSAAEFADMTLWYLFLASIGAEGLVDWSTMAMEMSGCLGAKVGNSSTSPDGATTTPTRTGISNGGEWWTNNPKNPKITASLVVPAGHAFFIGWAARIGDPATRVAIPCTSVMEFTEAGILLDQHVVKEVNGKIAQNIVFHKGINTTGRSGTARVTCWGNFPLNHDEAFFLSGRCSLSLIKDI